MTLQLAGDLLIYAMWFVLSVTIVYYFFWARWELHIAGRHTMWWTLWTDLLFAYWSYSALVSQSSFDLERNAWRIIISAGFLGLSLHRFWVLWCAQHPDHPYSIKRRAKERLRQMQYDAKRARRELRRVNKSRPTGRVTK